MHVIDETKLSSCRIQEDNTRLTQLNFKLLLELTRERTIEGFEMINLYFNLLFGLLLVIETHSRNELVLARMIRNR